MTIAQREVQEPMSNETIWERHGLERKIAEILSAITYENPDHHFGRPFLTAYQLAILFKERFREDYELLGYPVGGRGSGGQFTLSSYLSGQLSQKIRTGEISEIEGSFISNSRLRRIEFNDSGETITSSNTETEYDLSMYRLRG